MTAPTDTRDGDTTPEDPRDGLSANDLRAPITLPEAGTGARTGRRRGGRAKAPRPPVDPPVPTSPEESPSERIAPAPPTPAPPPAEPTAPTAVPGPTAPPVPPAPVAPPVPPAPSGSPAPPVVRSPPSTAPTEPPHIPPPLPPVPGSAPATSGASGGRPGSAPRSLLLLVVAVGVLVIALVAMAWAILDRLTDTVSSADDDGGVAAAAATVDSRSRAIAVHRVAGEVVGVTVVALGNGNSGGAAVFVPPGALLDVPGGEPDRLDSLDGDDMIELAVENLIGAPVGLVVSLDEEAWVEELPPTFVFDNPAPIERTLADGQVELLYPAGPVDVTPAEIPFLIAARSGNETDLDRLVRQQRVWEAWMEAVAVADRPVAGEPTTDLDTFTAALARGAIDYRLLPVEVVDPAAQLYLVDGSEAPIILAALAPERLAEGDGSRVQLLNGVGIPGLATDVAAILVPEGLAVPLTDNADKFGYSRTQIVYYRPEGASTATSVRDLLGVGDVVESRTVLDAVDVTVVIGEDLASRIGVGELTAMALPGEEPDQDSDVPVGDGGGEPDQEN